MNTYEFFTEYYSTIIDANNIDWALKIFTKQYNDEIIAIVQVNHPIHKEFISHEHTTKP